MQRSYSLWRKKTKWVSTEIIRIRFRQTLTTQNYLDHLGVYILFFIRALVQAHSSYIVGLKLTIRRSTFTAYGHLRLVCLIMSLSTLLLGASSSAKGKEKAIDTGLDDLFRSTVSSSQYNLSLSRIDTIFIGTFSPSKTCGDKNE